jgi:CheY-like chemotaxis protein
LLISLGYRGTKFTRQKAVKAVLGLLSTMQFDVVISHLNLPGKLNGIDILAALKTITSHPDYGPRFRRD